MINLKPLSVYVADIAAADTCATTLQPCKSKSSPETSESAAAKLYRASPLESIAPMMIRQTFSVGCGSIYNVCVYCVCNVLAADRVIACASVVRTCVCVRAAKMLCNVGVHTLSKEMGFV